MSDMRKKTRPTVARLLLIGLSTMTVLSPSFASEQKDPKVEAQNFIDEYATTWVDLVYKSQLADWKANTEIVEGDETNGKLAAAAAEKLAAFTGSKENIDGARLYLAEKSQLTDLQVRQLESILFNAANNPATAGDLVSKRISLDTQQTEKLYGFDFKLDGKSVSTNQLDDILKTSTDIEQRRRAWEASKEVGPGLKAGLAEQRDLRNRIVKSLGYSSYFGYQVSEYGMSSAEMRQLVDRINKELRPLYRELHTYARYELARRYNKPVPDKIPADWLPNRWGQDWSPMVTVAGFDVDSALKQKSPEWIVRQGEDFYVSLGFPKLPQSFWDKSSLYPAPPGAPYKKNNHASAWHLDLNNDIRSLMSVEPNAEWYETAHHELGHIYYYISYTNPDVPVLLRSGANRAYHEAMGSLMGLASMQRPYLESRGILEKGVKVDPDEVLLREALNYVVFIPFAAGVMPGFELDLYEKNIPESRFNKTWWDLAGRYQGIAPPTARGENYCDACTKTHIIDDPAGYYDYALSIVILFQLHDHIARNILKQDPHATNYYGNKQVGDFLRDIMRPGASRDWRIVLKEKTGEDLSAKAMLRYFDPLMTYLKRVNKGRKYTLPRI